MRGGSAKTDTASSPKTMGSDTARSPAYGSRICQCMCARPPESVSYGNVQKVNVG